MHDLGGPLAEAKSRLEVARLKRNWAEEDAERCSSRVREFLGKAESVGSVESETLEGLRARLGKDQHLIRVNLSKSPKRSESVR